MEFLSQINNDKDVTTREYVHEYVTEVGGWINAIQVDGIEQPIVNKTVNIVNKTDKLIEGQNGNSSVANATDGGMLKFVHTDGTESVVRVKDGGDNGEAASIAALKGAKGAKLIVRTDGIYVIQDKTTIDVENDKVATLGNIPYPYFSAQKKETPTEGYFATYYIADKKGGQCGVDINIPKDFLVKKAEMKYCEQEGVPLPELHIGDPYIDLTINVKEGATEESHLYINVKNLVDIYTAGNGITVVDNVISAKAVEANGLSVVAEGIKLDIADTTHNGAMTMGQVSKLEGISESAKKVEASTTNGNIKIDGTETVVYNDAAIVSAIGEKQDKLTAGENITITDNVISAAKTVYSAGNGIYINDNAISTKLGNGLKHTDDGQITLKAADRSISVGEFGVHVPVVTTSLDVTDNGLAVKLADNTIEAYNSGTGTKGIRVNQNVIQPKLTAGENITITDNVISAKDTVYDDTEVRSLISAKADSTDLISHTGNADIHVTADNKTAWNAMGVLGKDITVNTALGGYAVGDVIPSTATWQSIIEKLLG